MNFIVAMKQVPDLQHLRIRNREPIMTDIPLTFASVDKSALEAAVQLKEANQGEVMVVSVGNKQLEDTIKEAMAAGGDKAYLLIDEDQDFDSENTARILVDAIKKVGDYGLILFGEGSADNYSSQVGSRVAQMLDLPQVGFVTAIHLQDGKAIVTRSLEEKEEVLEITLPAVVMVASGINEPRLPSVMQVMKAGKKPKEILEIRDLGIELGESKIETLSNLAPMMDRKRVVVKSVSELLQILKSDGILGR